MLTHAKAVTIGTKYLPHAEYLVGVRGFYREDNTPAIELRNVRTGEREARVSVCMAEWALIPPSGHVYIKTWNENEGILEELVRVGVLDAPDKSHDFEVNQWGDIARLCRLHLPGLSGRPE